MTTFLYQGHGSFRLVTDQGTVVYIDPFAGEGYDLPADLVLVSHEHGDHNQVGLVQLKPDGRVLRAADFLRGGTYGSVQQNDVLVQSCAAYNKNHPKSSCVGFVLSAGGKKLYLACDTSETEEMKETYGDDRRTVIDPNAIDSDEEDLIPREQVVITISADNYIKRIPLSTYRQQSRGGVGLTAMQTKEEDHVASMFVTSSHDYVMFITNHGRLHWLKGYRIPEGSRQSKGKPIVNLLADLEEGEKVVNTVCASGFPEDRYLVFCTRNGLFKKTALSAYGNVRAKGIKAIKLDEGDELIETGITDGFDQIIIASADGQAVRFDESDARPTGRDTMGVKGMTLNDGDRVVSMAVVKPGDRLLTVSENGYGKISDVDDYRKTKRGGKGVITIKTDERNGQVVSVRKVNNGDQLMLTSASGKIIRIDTDEIRETGRNAKGVRVMDMRNGDKVVAVEPVMTEEQEEEIEEAAPEEPQE